MSTWQEKLIAVYKSSVGWTNDPEDTGKLGDNHMPESIARELEQKALVTLTNTGNGYYRVYLTDRGRFEARRLEQSQ